MRRLVSPFALARLAALLLFVSLVCVIPAQAAKMTASWTPPTQNTDGSPLTDLASYRIEWGSCTTMGAFDVTQASIIVNAPATSAAIYPTQLNPVCVRVFTRNTAGVESSASGVVQATPPGALQKPVTLGKPVILPPTPH